MKNLHQLPVIGMLGLTCLCLVSCMVSPDELEKQGILGKVWESAGKELKSGPTRYTPLEDDLFSATRAGELGEALEALEMGASIMGVNEAGETLLQIAIAHEQLALLKVYLERGAKPTIQDICMAFQMEYFNSVMAMLEYAESLDGLCDDGFTPLILAIRWGDPDYVRAIIDNGASTAFANENGLYPWQYAEKQDNLAQFPDPTYNYEAIKLYVTPQNR